MYVFERAVMINIDQSTGTFYDFWYTFIIHNLSSQFEVRQSILSQNYFYGEYETEIEYDDMVDSFVKVLNELYFQNQTQIGNLNRTVITMAPIYEGSSYEGMVYITEDYYKTFFNTQCLWYDSVSANYVKSLSSQNYSIFNPFSQYNSPLDENS